MKVIAINAGPRKGWNTDLLMQEAVKGVSECGAEVEWIDLFRLEKFTGCVSCFGCKRQASYGRCVCHDGLHAVLEKIRAADALIIGSPVYFGDLTASFRALYERLMFQYLTYNAETPCCNERKIPVLLLTSGNCVTEMLERAGIASKLDGYRNMMSGFIGPTTVLYAGNTLQVQDYSKFNWTLFNPEKKAKSREENFPRDLQKAYEAGRALLG